MGFSSAAISSSLWGCCNNGRSRPPQRGSIKISPFDSNHMLKSKNLKISEVFSKAQSTRSTFCASSAIDFEERTSPAEVKKEIEQCYELIQNLGRGAVYLGSSRLGPNHPHYVQAFDLAEDIANLLNCTSWSGAGPGLMDAVTKGAVQSGKPVGGLKIAKEAGEWTATNFHPYLPSDSYLTCRFFSARKHGLVDAAVRVSESDKTAVIALPGGIGTLDEAFEILALIQLKRIGSTLPVPFLLMNYDSFYSKLLEFIEDCEGWGTVSSGELASLWKVCNTNYEALAYLAEYYGLSY
ncbi:Putative lysine decarboxylase family protein [Striga hermonthica]|uniref:Lysine decarboxylase family protein n=1 Tax=Striga hermonthica TaxID=68872 RepID=A0A9N7R7J7_STRHE|nr:Putative lysine decarboxylase family protein [Striga hermonthica]